MKEYKDTSKRWVEMGPRLLVLRSKIETEKKV